jgi:hypothetical protein
MTSDTLSAPADADSPDADRAGPAMPEHIARLLYILVTLIDAGRRLAAILEQRTLRRSFWLFRAVFGTPRSVVILAHIHRGIRRAIALESLLREHAAIGRDVVAPPLQTRIAASEDPNADLGNEPFNAQVARLTSERAQRDAPADPDHPATAEQIDAEIRAHPIGHTIDNIRRDLGIVAMMCTPAFWDAMTDAIVRYQDSVAQCLDDAQPEPDSAQREPAEDPPSQQSTQGPDQDPRQSPRREIDQRPAAQFRTNAAMPLPHHTVTVTHKPAAVAARATGPPLREATKFAA